MSGDQVQRTGWEHIEVFIAFDDVPHRGCYLIHYGLDGRARSYRWVRESTRRGARGGWSLAVHSPYGTWLEGNGRQAVWQRMRDLLARLGADGWEAVSMTTEGDPNEPNLRYLFRRRDPGTTSGGSTPLNDVQS